METIGEVGRRKTCRRPARQPRPAARGEACCNPARTWQASGEARRREARQGRQGMAGRESHDFGRARQAWQGSDWRDRAAQGSADGARLGVSWRGMGPARQACHGKASRLGRGHDRPGRRGMARRDGGTAGSARFGLGKAGLGEAAQAGHVWARCDAARQATNGVAGQRLTRPRTAPQARNQMFGCKRSRLPAAS